MCVCVCVCVCEEVGREHSAIHVYEKRDVCVCVCVWGGGTHCEYTHSIPPAIYSIGYVVIALCDCQETYCM